MIDHEDKPDLFASPPKDDAVPAARPAAEPMQEAAIGARLRAAREAGGLDIADCAAQLHLPAKVLERMEAGDFGEPGHFVFLRGALQGYARFLGLPAGSCDQALRAVAPVEQPALVSVARTSPARWLLQRYGTAMTYIVLTATIAVPLVLLGLRGGLERPTARIVSLDQAPATAQHVVRASKAISAPATSTSPDETPFRASMTPFAAIGLSDTGATTDPAQRPMVETGQHTLTVSASADCWFEITDADGGKVDSGMLYAGDTRTWHSTAMLHVTLGNAEGVAVTSDGELLPLDSYRHANVAHFDVFTPRQGNGENN